MAERVAPGRILVPATVVLGVAAAGMASGQAATRDASLQIRVQVVEACAITVGPAGLANADCSGGAQSQSLPAITAGDAASPPPSTVEHGTAADSASEDRVRYITVTY